MSEDEVTMRMKNMFVVDCKQKIETLQHLVDNSKKKIEAYRKIEDKLDEMIKKLESPILAPICGVAFFSEAYAIHTNEVMIDLGNDYFVECSSFSARKIINRRVKDFEKSIKDGEESIKMIEEKLEYTENLFNGKDQDVVEITEPYDENKENEFYEVRRRRKTQKNLDKAQEELAHKKVMSRLDELELLENENGETPSWDIENGEVDNDEAENIEKLLKMPGVSEKEMEKLLQFLDDCDITSSEEDEEQLDSDDYEENEGKTILEIDNSIKIKEVIASESGKKKKKAGIRFSEELEKIKLFSEAESISVNDIDVKSKSEIKSILVNKEPTPVKKEDPQSRKEISELSNSTFPGMIVEKEYSTIIECEPSTSQNPPMEVKRVSRFKATRKGQ